MEGIRNLIGVVLKITGIGLIASILYEGGRVIDEMTEEYLEMKEKDKKEEV